MEAVGRNLPNEIDDGGFAPPSDRHSEQAVLGSILLDNSQYDRIAGVVCPADFYDPSHREIYSAIQSLVEDQDLVDIVTVANWLANVDKLEEVGGREYLFTLSAETPHYMHIESYAKVVRSHALLRNLAKSAQDIQRLVYNRGDKEAEEILSTAQQKLSLLSSSHGSSDGLLHIKDTTAEVLEHISLVYKEGRDSLAGLKTGFRDLDDITSGFQRSNLIIIAGRPGMGKTTLATNIAEYVAVNDKKTVAVFSLEMSTRELTTRLLSSLSSIDSKKIRDVEFGNKAEAKHVWDKLSNAANMLETAPIYIDASTDVTPIEILTRSRKLHREHNLDLVVVDYLQLLQVKDAEENRSTELANITRSLKNLARELDIPVIALSQLNRNVENRPNKRPVLADLRDSGAIEQDADVILFIYRDEIYNEDTDDYGIAEINVAKHRNGETNKFKLTFFNQFTRFNDFIDDRNSYAEGVGDVYYSKSSA